MFCPKMKEERVWETVFLPEIYFLKDTKETSLYWKTYSVLSQAIFFLRHSQIDSMFLFQICKCDYFYSTYLQSCKIFCICSQDDDFTIANDWFSRIETVIVTLSQKELVVRNMLQQKSATMDGAASSFPPRGSLADGASTTSTLLSTSSSKRGSSKVNRTKSLKLTVGGQMVVSGGSSEPDSPSVVNVPIVKEKSKIRDKLRKFFLRRPNMEDLMKRGIMKNEPVFGSTLVILSKVRYSISFTW